jgi:hypothetical protein
MRTSLAILALLLVLAECVTANAAQSDEIRAVVERFVAAQNAHDLAGVSALLWDSPDFLWITRGHGDLGARAIAQALRSAVPGHLATRAGHGGPEDRVSRRTDRSHLHADRVHDRCCRPAGPANAISHESGPHEDSARMEDLKYLADSRALATLTTESVAVGRVKLCWDA